MLHVQSNPLPLCTQPRVLADGRALIDAHGQVVQLLSYEGAFSASSGPAAGLGSTDLGVSEPGNTPIPIAILPLGSANNIACSLGIEADPLEIASAGWRETEVRRLDVGTAAGPWGKWPFVEAVGMGVLAEALAAVEDADVKGTERSRLARDAL